MAVHILSWDEQAPPRCRNGAVAIGNFDGVHLGHQAIARVLHEQGARIHGPGVAVTFDPHPLKLLRPEQYQPVLTTAAHRAALLQAYGADEVIVLRTTPELLCVSASDFFRRVIQSSLATKALVEGPDFGFGRNREGTVERLTTWCRETGLELVVVPPYRDATGQKVSSSRVRDALGRGAVRDAAALLGRPYQLSGVVGPGEGRGRTLGFPTANLHEIETLVPGDGVYAARAHYQDRACAAAVHIGPNPTFGERVRKVEAHLIGFQGDLNGVMLSLDLIDRLRATRPFGSADELVAQLRRDVEQTASLVGGSAPLRDRVERALVEGIAPALGMDAAELQVLDVLDGVARIRLANRCASCPGTILTIISAMEQEIQARVPEIKYVEVVP